MSSYVHNPPLPPLNVFRIILPLIILPFFSRITENPLQSLGNPTAILQQSLCDDLHVIEVA